MSHPKIPDSSRRDYKDPPVCALNRMPPKPKSVDEEGIPVTYVRPSNRTQTWEKYLRSVRNLPKIPTVNMFKHAPGAPIWESLAIPNIVVELRNPFAICQTDVFWVATLVYYAGYFALAKFERFGSEPHQLSWISFYSNVPKPLGWCKKNGKLLHPGRATARAHPNYMEKLEEFVVGKQTISPYHVEIFTNEISSMVNVNPALPVECRDTEDLVMHKLGRISVICGDRLHVEYLDSLHEGEKTGAWFTRNDDGVHALGWSETVGHDLDITQRTGIQFRKLPGDNFPKFPTQMKIKAGMYMETRHPRTPHKIVVAVIVEVLQMGFFVAETCDKLADDRVKFSSHVTSPFIFPLGWGLTWGIEVENHMDGHMGYREYLPLEFIPSRPPHYFQPGMVLEAIDITQTSFCGPATVLKVADHMLYIHFNNWDLNIIGNSMWVDAEFSQIYPIGYSELIGLAFQGHV